MHYISTPISWVTLLVLPLLWACGGLAMAEQQAGGTPAGSWQHTVEVPRADRKGKPSPPAVVTLWLPENLRDGGRVRGLVVAGDIEIENQLVKSAVIREAAAEAGLGIVHMDPSLDATFDWVHRDSGERFDAMVSKLAEVSGHPELTHAPLLTVGHSTGGIFARNIAYWRPEQTLGVLHIKSGNFQDGIPDGSRSLRGVPLLAINGEFEQYGPKGGDLKGGLRSQYSVEENKMKRNQTQWLLVRKQLIDRRRKHPDNLMGLVVHRGGSHTTWDDEMTRLAAQFIRSAAAARLPEELPTEPTEPVKLRPLTAESGWLADADIKHPSHEPAAYAEYEGTKQQALWYPDEAMAKAVHEYHQQGWETPDPTAGEGEERYSVPPELRDEVDATPGPR